ncbi:hypothetical protein PsorP6_012349 [Peronosclerospora sorghi]|uniref:Uncharacterized protein n=1 Tax=Peronosclerospora sorghi TaxID=230839 RepID=A0ACC0WFW9_9STRA|nr:hypothetical protein PsorP6_012349 [Peronosclerospora sorghi]
MRQFATLLQTEYALQEFLSFLHVLRGELQIIAQGIFHSSISVKYNTVVLTACHLLSAKRYLLNGTRSMDNI